MSREAGKPRGGQDCLHTPGSHSTSLENAQEVGVQGSGSGPANPLTQLDFSFPICMTGVGLQWLSPKVQCGRSDSEREERSENGRTQARGRGPSKGWGRGPRSHSPGLPQLEKRSQASFCSVRPLTTQPGPHTHPISPPLLPPHMQSHPQASIPACSLPRSLETGAEPDRSLCLSPRSAQ